MNGRSKLYTKGLWFGKPPDRPFVEILVNDVPVYLEQLAGVAPRTVGAPVNRFTWDQFVNTWTFGSVHDFLQQDSSIRFRTLFPLLEPGGAYELLTPINEFSDLRTDPIQTIAARYDRFFAAYIKRFVDRWDRLPTSLHIVKAEFPQWTGVEVSISDLKTGIPPTLHETTYRRVQASIYGSSQQSSRLRRVTNNYSSQFVNGQRWLELKLPIVEGYGQVHPSDGSVLSESFSHLRNTKRGLLHAAYGTQQYASELSLDPNYTVQTVSPCVLLKQPWDSNYGHWLVDNFGRMAGATFPEFTEFHYLVSKISNPAMNKVVRDTLALVGISEDHIVEADMHPVRVHHALYPEPITQAPLTKHPAVIRFLESLVDRALARGGENRAPGGRIYITRNRGKRRRLLNEDSVIDLVQSADYTVVAPEELSLYDQIATFGSASQVIGNMGAAMTNLVFSPKGVSLACIANTVMPHDYFYDIVCHKEGEYVGVQGSGARAIGDDFSVDMNVLQKVLRSHQFI